MKSRGFTLIELLVVISIISVLSTVVMASLNSARDKARLSATTSSLLQIQKAVQLYAVDHNGGYPLDEGIGDSGLAWGYIEYIGNLSYPGDPPFSNFLNKITPSYLSHAPNFNRISFLNTNQTNLYVGLTYYVFPNSKAGANNIFGYTDDPENAVFCGGTKKEKYIIMVGSDQTLKLNIPELSYVSSGTLHTNPIGTDYYYCIGE